MTYLLKIENDIATLKELKARKRDAKGRFVGKKRPPARMFCPNCGTEIALVGLGTK